jgi:uncharacterized protein
MDKLPAFQQYQYAFAAHIRDPGQNRRPAGVEARRMAIYNELLYNNAESFLLTCFPVMHKMLGKRRWGKLVRQFLAVHRSHTPYFRQIPDEFFQFLQDEWGGGDGYPEYLLDLAHYEWIELVLSVSSQDEHIPAHDAEGDLLAGIPVLNPVLANLAYQWPVHRIRPRTKIEKAPTYLLVFRTPDMQMRFMEQSAVSARLIKLLEPAALTGKQAVAQLAMELGYADPGPLIAFARDFLQSLRQAGALIGTNKRAESGPLGP